MDSTGASFGEIHLRPTRILDFADPAIVKALTQLAAAGDARQFLTAAHAWVSATVRPRYSMDDFQAASRTLRVGAGSCSQKMALLEALSRGHGIPTRVHGFLVDGSYWRARFPRMTWILPSTVPLAWPEFLVDAEWIDLSQVGAVAAPDASRPEFANVGANTMFEAAPTHHLPWSCAFEGPGRCPLDSSLVDDLGTFDTRDAFYASSVRPYPRAIAWLGDMLLRFKRVA